MGMWTDRDLKKLMYVNELLCEGTMNKTQSFSLLKHTETYN